LRTTCAFFINVLVTLAVTSTVATLALACDQGKGVARCGPNNRPGSVIVREENSKCQWGHWPLLLVGESVTTLTLACDQGKGVAKCGPRSRPGSHITCSRECKKSRECEGMNPHTPKWTPTLGVGGSWSPKRTPKTSESVLRGQNSMACCVLYINGKLLKRRCLKWARIAHFNIWNTSYGQKKGRESNSRESANFDSRPLKVRNRPDLLGCRRRATYRWKALDEGYNFASDCIAIGGLQKKLCAFKVPEVLAGGILGLPRGSPGREKPFGCRPRGEAQSIL
jgi:hypothetical protein